MFVEYRGYSLLLWRTRHYVIVVLLVVTLLQRPHCVLLAVIGRCTQRPYVVQPLTLTFDLSLSMGVDLWFHFCFMF